MVRGRMPEGRECSTVVTATPWPPNSPGHRRDAQLLPAVSEAGVGVHGPYVEQRDALIQRFIAAKQS